MEIIFQLSAWVWMTCLDHATISTSWNEFQYKIWFVLSVKCQSRPSVRLKQFAAIRNVYEYWVHVPRKRRRMVIDMLKAIPFFNIIRLSYTFTIWSIYANICFEDIYKWHEYWTVFPRFHQLTRIIVELELELG